MNPAGGNLGSEDQIQREAARWVLRLDRGLSAVEQDAYSQWLAADPRHRRAVAAQRWGWQELDRLAGLQASVSASPDPDLLVPRGWPPAHRFRCRRRPVAVAIAAVVMAAGGLIWIRISAPEPLSPLALALLAPPCEQRALEDGSAVELRRDSALSVAFTAGERQVTLSRGEAHFNVAKNSAWPFIVAAGGAEIRAIGTAFDVRLRLGAVDVVVTEGHVRVAPSARSHAAPVPVDAVRGQWAEVLLGTAGSAARVSNLGPAEIDARLAWLPRLLDFTGARLTEIVDEFNRHNEIKLVVGDPALRELRLSATFRSDNIKGFVRLMQSDFGMRADQDRQGEIVLFRSP